MSDAVGFALQRPRGREPVEQFYAGLVAGLEAVLLPRGLHVLTQVVDHLEEELEAYARWAGSGLAVGAVVTNLQPEDRRPALLRRLALPSVLLGEPDEGVRMAVVRTDNSGAMIDAVRQLAALGHTSVGHVTGPHRLLHTQARARAFEEEAARRGMVGLQVEADYSPSSGAQATRVLLRAVARPTAIIYDNDAMAVAALTVAEGLGLRVPGDVSLVAWDDSVNCRLAHPPLSAMSHDVHQVGQLAAEALCALLRGEPAVDVTAPLPVFVARGSTAPRPARTQRQPAGRR